MVASDLAVSWCYGSGVVEPMEVKHVWWMRNGDGGCTMLSNGAGFLLLFHDAMVGCGQS